MSFGFSPRVILILISLTKDVYDSWKAAGAVIRDITQTLGTFKIVLEHVERRFDAPALSARQQEFDSVLHGCKTATDELHAVRQQYRKLRDRGRIALGLKVTRAPMDRLARHVGLLNGYLMALDSYSLGEDVSAVEASSGICTPQFGILPAAFGKVIDIRSADNASVRSSIVTAHGDDDRQAYRELRRFLRDLGIGGFEL